MLRIVIPFRDYNRVKSIFDLLAKKDIKTSFSYRDPIFPVRGDMDVLEYIYIIKLDKKEKNELYKELSKKLSGTIGFFLLYKYDEKGDFSKI